MHSAMFYSTTKNQNKVVVPTVYSRGIFGIGLSDGSHNGNDIRDLSGGLYVINKNQPAIDFLRITLFTNINPGGRSNFRYRIREKSQDCWAGQPNNLETYRLFPTVDGFAVEDRLNMFRQLFFFG